MSESRERKVLRIKTLERLISRHRPQVCCLPSAVFGECFVFTHLPFFLFCAVCDVQCEMQPSP